MTWSPERERPLYTNPEERRAYVAGYSDGYHGYPMWSGNERDWHPNAYSKGYWSGHHDGEHDA